MPSILRPVHRLVSFQSMDPRRFQREFVERLDHPWQLGELFDYLPNTYFFSKNLSGQYVMVNRAMALHRGAYRAGRTGWQDGLRLLLP